MEPTIRLTRTRELHVQYQTITGELKTIKYPVKGSLDKALWNVARRVAEAQGFTNIDLYWRHIHRLKKEEEARSREPFRMKVLARTEAERLFRFRRLRATQADSIIRRLETLSAGQALLVDGLLYYQAAGLRQRLQKAFPGEWIIRVQNLGSSLYQVLIHHTQKQPLPNEIH